MLPVASSLPRLNSPLFIGGIDPQHASYYTELNQTTQLPPQLNYIGCLRQVRIGGRSANPVNFTGRAMGNSLGCGMLSMPCSSTVTPCVSGYCRVTQPNSVTNRLIGECVCPATRTSASCSEGEKSGMKDAYKIYHLSVCVSLKER